MILSNQHGNGLWHIDEGVIRNDAYHISSPSPKGEGAYQSLMSVVKYADVNDIAVINAHSAATMYNDQMESMAIHRAGLSDVPVNALKGYFGHTMGAAGILETIMTMHSIDAGITLGTRNFEELGVSGTINISPSERNTDKSCFVKIISGFGGGNAGIVVSRKPYAKERIQSPRFHISHRVVMTDKSLTIDDKTQPVEASGDRLLTALYKERIGDYPRFYKMDSLSKLGFLATEILIKAENSSDCEHPTSRAIAFFNHKASLKTDIEYLETINDKDNFFPSPSLFVYTLPNIVTGRLPFAITTSAKPHFISFPKETGTGYTTSLHVCSVIHKLHPSYPGGLNIPTPTILKQTFLSPIKLSEYGRYSFRTQRENNQRLNLEDMTRRILMPPHLFSEREASVWTQSMPLK